MSKTNRPIKGDGEYRKHRNKHQKRYYWKRERQAHKRSCRIRGYLSTLRKQDRNLLNALIGLFSGNPEPLIPQPE